MPDQLRPRPRMRASAASTSADRLPGGPAVTAELSDPDTPAAPAGPGGPDARVGSPGPAAPTGRPVSPAPAGPECLAGTGSSRAPQSRQSTTPSAFARWTEPHRAHRSRPAAQSDARWQPGQTRTCSPSTTARRQGLAPRSGSDCRTRQRKHGMTGADGRGAQGAPATRRPAPSGSRPGHGHRGWR
jgi:hypothetical protein